MSSSERTYTRKPTRTTPDSRAMPNKHTLAFRPYGERHRSTRQTGSGKPPGALCNDRLGLVMRLDVTGAHHPSRGPHRPSIGPSLPHLSRLPIVLSASAALPLGYSEIQTPGRDLGLYGAGNPWIPGASLDSRRSV